MNVKEYQEQRNSYQQYDFIEILKSFQKKINRNLYVASLAVVNSIDNELITCTPFPVRKDDRVNTIIAYNLTQRVLNEGDKVLILFTDRDFRDTYSKVSTNENTIGETNDENLHSQSYGIIIQCLGEDSGGGSKIVIDSKLDPDSTNPVQNKVIYNALQNIIDDIEANTTSITNLNTSVGNLTTDVDKNKTDISNINSELENKADKSDLDNYVTLTTEQTKSTNSAITGKKEFTANNVFSGSNTFSGGNTFSANNNFTNETRFTNASYFPTYYDIANGIGKSSIFTRGAMLQEFVCQIIAPNVNATNANYSFTAIKDNIKFQYVTAANGSKPTLVDMAQLSPSGLSVRGDSLTVGGEQVALARDLMISAEEIEIDW